jgi:hypothetical protein
MVLLPGQIDIAAKTSVAKTLDEVAGLGVADRPVVGVAGLGAEAGGLGAEVAALGVGVAGLGAEAARLGVARLGASGLERSFMMSRRRYQPMRPVVTAITTFPRQQAPLGQSRVERIRFV